MVAHIPPHRMRHALNFLRFIACSTDQLN
jgi:hypothetical protein